MSHGNNQIQIVDLADNVNAAVDKINENFELVETGTFSSVDSSSVTNIVNNILDSDYFTTIINEDYINNITTNLNVDLTDVEAGIAANASAISSLTTSITDIDGTLTILASDVTSLSTSLTDTQAGITANSTAIASLTSSITQTENSLWFPLSLVYLNACQNVQILQRNLLLEKNCQLYQRYHSDHMLLPIHSQCHK